MKQDEIIKMAREAGFTINELHCSPPIISFIGHEEAIEAFAKLVAEKATEEANARANASWTLMCKKMVAFEREKSLKLWMLLDDVDTADDIAKADDAIYRSLCRQTHKKRWDVLTGDDVDNAIRGRT